jgi:hypothetical protein
MHTPYVKCQERYLVISSPRGRITLHFTVLLLWKHPKGEIEGASPVEPAFVSLVFIRISGCRGTTG